MKIYAFTIEKIELLRDIGMFQGTVSIGLSDENEEKTGSRLTLSVRVKGDAGDTLQEVETSLLRKSAEVLGRLTPLLASATADALHRRVEPR